MAGGDDEPRSRKALYFGAFALAVRLEVALPAASPEVAQQVIEQAHQVCPYSNATRGNVEVTLEVA